ncbi:TAXI family TRAP transporter solute-binding subunit [Kushneria phosphatilytica]|uniref:TAXI family TRAP transporter solute-binding subunit n=1 Tax=Kushneria phosphatilytica TaxID=657387 RepID=A0A1S1NLP0_9GAMM|nr:TAXI family TRAP transporter solute-binding subunit [Kushneria phosphatilytica]OHV07686.1 C4-dicarboxylate ABC transporter substrate-binding protein [Kushneria phosphatilytica]QEL10184.1 TAXI family TRAP transporter solute-binding subunit [Kushneria phosphatilytica]
MNIRTLTLAAAIALLGLGLGGCGGGDDEPSDQAQSEQQQQNANSEQSTGSAGNDTQQSSTQASGDAQSGNDTDQQAGEPVSLIFGTGGTSGSYYPIGGALKSVFERSDLINNVQVVSTGASVQNIQNIADGLNQIAIVMSDVAYDALKGQGQFQDNPVEIRALAGLYPNVVQVVATANSNIHSISDLAGKRVGVGKVGSGVEQSAQKVLEAAGMSYDDLARVSHTGYADSVTEMGNGNLDAAFFTSGVPNSSITGLMQNNDVVFVPVSGDTADKLLKAYPYYQHYEIPAHTAQSYDLPQAVQTVAIRNMMIVPSSMRDDVARELAKRTYDYLGTDKVSVGALKRFDRNTMGTDLVAPLQPGARDFYESVNESGSDGENGQGAGDDQSGQ